MDQKGCRMANGVFDTALEDWAGEAWKTYEGGVIKNGGYPVITRL